ncbi:MAG: methionine biosynthesis protein MetW [Methylacidiphilales bacterium]|nr:methionine biosynthesis protein MetW [Candidatus Methylacidiphilales bacterium]
MHSGIYDTVSGWVQPNSRVLDLGAGDGAFLERLVKTRSILGEGVEKNAVLAARCVQRGLVVHQGDIADGLDQYGDGTFEFVLLLGTFQELISPAEIFREAFRVGRKLIVAYANFCHIRVRLQVLFSGRTPVTNSLPTAWHETPNLHFLSILDFQEFCRASKYREIDRAFFNANGPVRYLPNLRAEEAVSLLQSERLSHHNAPGERSKTEIK